MDSLRGSWARPGLPILSSGNIGPQADAYQPGTTLSATAAKGYHAAQVAAFADVGVDLVTALTVTYVEEAIGIVRAAVSAGVPVVISFTVETDGRLPSGQGLREDPVPGWSLGRRPLSGRWNTHRSGAMCLRFSRGQHRQGSPPYRGPSSTRADSAAGLAGET